MGLGEPESDFLEDVGAFFAKVVSGWYLGPWGLIAGLVAGGIEGVLPLPQVLPARAAGTGTTRNRTRHLRRVTAKQSDRQA